MQPSPDRLLRRALRTFAPYKPGTSVDEVRRRFGFTDPVKLSQNENPLGSSPKAMAALHAISSLSAYVEDDHAALRARLARPYGLGIESVTIGHGSNELVQLLFTAFVDPGEEIVTGKPTFSLFKKDADVAGARTIEVPLRDGVHDLPAMLAAVTERTKLVFVCDPNNPTGTRVERDALVAFARALPERVLLVLDQAYREYMDPAGTDGTDVLAIRPMTVVLRTVSKIYGLAALRFGYGFGSPEIVAGLNLVRLPFNVAGPAADAVLAALDDADFIARSRENNERGKAQLYAGFERLGVFAYPTAANFISVATPIAAQAAYDALLERGVIVRSGDGLGMPGFLRVTVGTPAENEVFLATYGELLAEWRARETGRGAAMSAQIVLRRGTAADRTFVLDLGRRTSIDSVSAFRNAPSRAIESSYENLVAFAFDRAYALTIAESSLDGPLGFVLMLEDLPDEVTGLPQGFVAYMAVEPDARRRGVAKTLLAAAEDAARAKGLPNVALMVTEDNVAARELYAQAGYVTERRLLCKTL